MRYLLLLLTTVTFLTASYHPALTERLVQFDDELLTKIQDMPVNPVNTKIWLMAIGVAKYDVTDDIIYSTQSAEAFSQLAIKRFGITPRRTYKMIGDDATSGRVKDTINLLVNNVQEGDTIIFYYSGHGIPSFPAKEPYILPKDKDPNFVTADSDLKLDNIYKKLQGSKADKVLAFVDACFSGATDNKTLFKGVAATRIKAKQLRIDSQKIAVLTAGQDKQFSNKYDKKHHRLFSYYLMDSLINGETNVQSLFQKVRTNVDATSYEFGDSFRQTPTMTGNENLSF